MKKYMSFQNDVENIDNIKNLVERSKLLTGFDYNFSSYVRRLLKLAVEAETKFLNNIEEQKKG
jgi:hypothetical protein